MNKLGHRRAWGFDFSMPDNNRTDEKPDDVYKLDQSSFKAAMARKKREKGYAVHSMHALARCPNTTRGFNCMNIQISDLERMNKRTPRTIERGRGVI